MNVTFSDTFIFAVGVAVSLIVLGAIVILLLVGKLEEETMDSSSQTPNRRSK